MIALAHGQPPDASIGFTDMDTKKPGPISAKERREYRARYADRNWTRPTSATAAAVWALLEDGLPTPIDVLVPKRHLAEDAFRSTLVAKQSLVVALDCAVVAGDEGRMLTF